METRYFQCSARNSAESRMPRILMKYLPLIKALENGGADEAKILEAARQCATAETA